MPAEGCGLMPGSVPPDSVRSLMGGENVAAGAAARGTSSGSSDLFISSSGMSTDGATGGWVGLQGHPDPANMHSLGGGGICGRGGKPGTTSTFRP